MHQLAVEATSGCALSPVGQLSTTVDHFMSRPARHDLLVDWAVKSQHKQKLYEPAHDIMVLIA